MSHCRFQNPRMALRASVSLWLSLGLRWMTTAPPPPCTTLWPPPSGIAGEKMVQADAYGDAAFGVPAEASAEVSLY